VVCEANLSDERGPLGSWDVAVRCQPFFGLPAEFDGTGKAHLVLSRQK
jgi:hypothetical protein